MAEYIEREAVINDIGELFTICFETLPNECGHHFIVEKELQAHLDFVKNISAADVVPVVRCYDCELWEAYTGHNGDEGLGWCDNGVGDTTHALFFCASGRRAERI